MKNKLEEIFRKHAIENNGTSLAEDGIPPTITFDMPRTAMVFKELSTLIQQERREAVEGFVEWFNEQTFNSAKITISLGLIEEYLNSIGSEESTQNETNGSAKKDDIPEEKYETSKIIEDINEILVEGFATSPSRCWVCEARTPKEEIAEKREANLTHIHNIAEEIVRYVKVKGLEEAKRILHKNTPSSISSIKKEFDKQFVETDSGGEIYHPEKLYTRSLEDVWNFFEPYLKDSEKGKGK